MSTIISIFLFIIIAIPFAIWADKHEREDREAEQRRAKLLEKDLDQYATYHYNLSCGHELILKNRGKQLAPAFKMRNQERITFAYQPTTYIYTSATVGGITTGGIEKIGGRNSVVKRKTTEKCELLYCGHELEYIHLTDELYREAKNSRIKRYLDKNSPRIIIVDTSKTKAVAAASTVFGSSSATTLNIYNDLKIEASHTYEECNEIIDWICGND